MIHNVYYARLSLGLIKPPLVIFGTFHREAGRDPIACAKRRLIGFYGASGCIQERRAAQTSETSIYSPTRFTVRQPLQSNASDDKNIYSISNYRNCHLLKYSSSTLFPSAIRVLSFEFSESLGIGIYHRDSVKYSLSLQKTFQSIFRLFKRQDKNDKTSANNYTAQQYTNQPIIPRFELSIQRFFLGHCITNANGA